MTQILLIVNIERWLRMKALFTYDYGNNQMSKIEALGYEILLIKENEIDQNLDAIVEFDPEVMVCYNPFNHLKLEALRTLKWIQLSSIGVDQVPVSSVLDQGITITNNRGGYSIPMGEWIVFQMLYHYKYASYFQKMKHEKKWKLSTEIKELTNKNALFIGTGTIAREAAKRLVGYEMNCFGVNTDGRDTPYFDKCYAMSDFDTCISEMDFVILTIPHTQLTEGLINASRLELMKRDAVLINVARGSLIVEDDLIAALEKGYLMGVSLDVFENEPLVASSALWEFDRVMITPHNSWISEHRNERRFEMIYKNLLAYKNGESLQNTVDLKRGY